jgi:hypothetical protein
MKRVDLGAVVLAAGLALWASAAPADERTTTQFVQTCHSDPEWCKSALSQAILDSDTTCVPKLNAVLTEIGNHPQWSGQPWLGSVDAAIGGICNR